MAARETVRHEGLLALGRLPDVDAILTALLAAKRAARSYEVLARAVTPRSQLAGEFFDDFLFHIC